MEPSIAGHLLNPDFMCTSRLQDTTYYNSTTSRRNY